MFEKVAVTGLGVVAPNGVGVEAFWQNVVAGRSGIKPCSWGARFGFKSRVLGRIDDLLPERSGLTPDELVENDRYVHLAMTAAVEAMNDAGLTAGAVAARRLGVSIASAIAGTGAMERDFITATENGLAPLNPRSLSRSACSTSNFLQAAALIAQRFGAAGPVLCLSTGCTAGLDAVGWGMEAIRRGKLDVAIVGASEAPLTPIAVGAFEAITALSTRGCTDPAQASCPYSLERDGFVLAEGCGILVLENFEHAKARGAKIYALLSGFGSVSNAHHMTDLAPEGIDLSRSIEMALLDAGVDPDDVEHVSAHGSSTPQNDVNETNALKRVFGGGAYNLHINSLKSMTGHALAAANAVEMVALCLELANGKLHPTINLGVSDPACDLDYIVDGARDLTINTALKIASGFSGIHSAIVAERF